MFFGLSFEFLEKIEVNLRDLRSPFSCSNPHDDMIFIQSLPKLPSKVGQLQILSKYSCVAFCEKMSIYPNPD